MAWPAQHISESINRTPEEVYAFAAKPENLPRWAAGLSGSALKKKGDHWLADSPMGEVTIAFAAPNTFGILDHDVTLPSGETVHNPMRVVRNDKTSEVIFTLFKRPGMTDQDFVHDGSQVKKDLLKLKAILEKGKE